MFSVNSDPYYVWLSHHSLEPVMSELLGYHELHGYFAMKIEMVFVISPLAQFLSFSWFFVLFFQIRLLR